MSNENYELIMQSPNAEVEKKILCGSLKELFEAKSKSNGCGILASSLTFEGEQMKYQKTTFGDKTNLVNLLIAILLQELSDEPARDKYEMLSSVERVISEELDRIEFELDD